MVIFSFHNLLKIFFLEKIEILQKQKVSWYQRMKNYMKKETKYLENKIYYENHLLYIEQAPEPNEINWEIFHHTTKDKIKSRILYNFLFIVVLLGSFGIIYLIMYYKSLDMEHEFEKLNEGDQSAIHEIGKKANISLIIAFLITAFNKFVLPKLLHYFSQYFYLFYQI